MHILVVEDEQSIAVQLLELLEREGFSATLAPDAATANRELASGRAFDLVLLDVMLPDGDGFGVVHTMRSHGATTPVLMLTARDGVEDRVRGLDAGADDYLAKPFAVPELMARVRALLRRGGGELADVVGYGGVELRRRARQATRDGAPLDVTGKEFELLELLLDHAGRAVSRETIARVVWRDVPRATPLDNIIEVHITRLRRKVDGSFPQRLIHTIRGVGYMISDSPP